jgi:excinuclease ABC subunit A
VIQNPELSLAGGAIRGWDRRNFYYFQMLKSLAEHYKFDVEAPWGTLSAACRKWSCTVQAKRILNSNT